MNHFKLTGVRPLEAMNLELSYADGEVFQVDIAKVIKGYPTLKGIRDVFSKVKLGDHGLSVVWNDDDDLELASDNLRARAIEQAGEFSHETILNWMARHSLTLDQAAIELGLSRRMLAYYRSGAKPVPRTVGLACIGWEQQQKLAA
ncbi:MAG: hypothetical protein WBC18_14765 [Ottowia sp.]|uniref:DUF2442 domain-containing protein n=1 Tax=Ottowia sp. TaxID=1898956 RepID=UPI003C746316